MVLAIEFKNKSFVSIAGDGSLSYESSAGGRTACIQASRSFELSDAPYAYFEVTLRIRSSAPAAIGLAPRGFFRSGKQCGTAPQSYGWDGAQVRNGDSVLQLLSEWRTGDTIGCGWEPERRIVFFTHNGKRLGKDFNCDVTSNLIPTLSFSGNDVFVPNFGVSSQFQCNLSEPRRTASVSAFTPDFAQPSSSSGSASSASSSSLSTNISTGRLLGRIAGDGTSGGGSNNQSLLVVHLPPNHFVHVLDRNTHLERLVVGPDTLTLQQNEILTKEPTCMIVVPPQHYCEISDPVVRKSDGSVEFGSKGYSFLHGDVEIRFSSEPFPLYPGEKLTIRPTKLPVVQAGEAATLKAKCNFVDSEAKKERAAGEVWQVVGPCTVIPRKEVVMSKPVKAHTVALNTALVVRALAACVDCSGKARKAGESYLVREVGYYLPTPDEVVLEKRNGYVLSPTEGLHLRAMTSFVDVFGKKRLGGSEWLLTHEDCSTHIADVYEEVVTVVNLIVLSKQQYCIITDPCDKNGVPCLGERELRTGPRQFFLQPGEALEGGVRNVYVLAQEDALLLRAREAFTDEGGKKRIAGERWLVSGPTEVVPHVKVDVVETRHVLAFDRSEGVYVRNCTTGAIRSVVGQVYMLGPEEEYWNKELPPKVEELINTANGKKRQKHELATVRVPHNSAVRVFDHAGMERVCFGPDLVLLEPQEEVQLISLSAGHPKVPNTIQTLCLRLGPDFMADTFAVDTSDHARLNLRLAYSWRFDVDKKFKEDAKTNPRIAASIFCVNDFVGDTCRTIAGRVRAAVSAVTFDEFHRHSSVIISKCVLGENMEPLRFAANRFLVTDVDVQRVEPSNAEMQRALSTSVQQAIEITTKATEMRASQEAEMAEQLANGRLLRQKMKDDGIAEGERMRLLQTLAEGAALRSTGVAMAEAKAKAEAARIEGEAAVELAKLHAEAVRVNHQAEMSRQQGLYDAELEHLKRKNDLQIQLQQELAEVEKSRFATVVNSLGPDTIATIANSQRRTQHNLLLGLGLKQVLFTSGSKQPINLFTSKGSMPPMMRRLAQGSSS